MLFYKNMNLRGGRPPTPPHSLWSTNTTILTWFLLLVLILASWWEKKTKSERSCASAETWFLLVRSSTLDWKSQNQNFKKKLSHRNKHSLQVEQSFGLFPTSASRDKKKQFFNKTCWCWRQQLHNSALERFDRFVWRALRSLLLSRLWSEVRKQDAAAILRRHGGIRAGRLQTCTYDLRRSNATQMAR